MCAYINLHMHAYMYMAYYCYYALTRALLTKETALRGSGVDFAPIHSRFSRFRYIIIAIIVIITIIIAIVIIASIIMMTMMFGGRGLQSRGAYFQSWRLFLRTPVCVCVYIYIYIHI